MPLIKVVCVLQIHKFTGRFANIPDMLELDHLTVSGDVTFGKDVTLKVIYTYCTVKAMGEQRPFFLPTAEHEIYTFWDYKYVISIKTKNENRILAMHIQASLE